MISNGPRLDRKYLLLFLCIGLLVLPAFPLSADEADPLEPINRKIFSFNDALDRWILRPVAKAYDTVLPDPVQRSIGNVFNNLSTPAISLNQFLQGKPKAGFSDAGRFLLNTTIGLGGIFDVASPNGLKRHEEDFGQTFAVWGVGKGAFLTLPLRGPATTTYAVGMVFDMFTNPLILISPNRDRIIAVAVSTIDARAELLPVEKLISGDKYLFIRDAYLQRREYLVRDGVIDEDPFLDDF